MPTAGEARLKEKSVKKTSKDGWGRGLFNAYIQAGRDIERL